MLFFEKNNHFMGKNLLDTFLDKECIENYIDNISKEFEPPKN